MKESEEEVVASPSKAGGSSVEVMPNMLNMNNSGLLQQMTQEQRRKMQQLIVYACVDHPNIRCVQMCNAGVDDSFLEIILRELLSEKGQSEACKVEELWLESNDISDKGVCVCVSVFV